MSQRVTMSDIAKQAGVSLMTVSRVVNKKGEVHADTRQQIEQIIQQLGYRPSGIARSLVTQKTRTIGLVVPDVSNPFFARVTRGVEHLAYAEGYNVFLCNAEEDPERELGVITSLQEKWVDGMILCSSRLDEETLVEQLSLLPAVVLINRRLENADADNDDLDSIIVNDQMGGEMILNHLLSSGHTAIGFAAGLPTSYSSRKRGQGYETALQSAGLSVDPSWSIHCKPTVAGGYEGAKNLLSKTPQLTALFCYNDLVAVGALQACAELGKRVPQDIAITGFDDISLAALVTPSLTTCRVPSYEMGAQAVHALIDRMNGCSNGCSNVNFQPELVIRQSAP